MLPFEDRYSRQRRLPEVGAAGQARLCAARVRVAPHPHLDIELDYLSRAGVGAVVDESQPALEAPFGGCFEHAAALGVAQGAWCALRRVKDALAEPSPRP